MLFYGQKDWEFGLDLEAGNWIWCIFISLNCINQKALLYRALNIFLDSKSPPPSAKTPDCSFKSLVTARDPLDSLAWALEKELPDPHAEEVWASLVNTASLKEFCTTPLAICAGRWSSLVCRSVVFFFCWVILCVCFVQVLLKRSGERSLEQTGALIAQALDKVKESRLQMAHVKWISSCTMCFV